MKQKFNCTLAASNDGKKINLDGLDGEQYYRHDLKKNIKKYSEGIQRERFIMDCDAVL